MASLLHKLATLTLLEAALSAYTDGVAAQERRGESSAMLPDCLFEVGKPLSMALAKPISVKYDKKEHFLDELLAAEDLQPWQVASNIVRR
jgi:hypothetical protein